MDSVVIDYHVMVIEYQHKIEFLDCFEVGNRLPHTGNRLLHPNMEVFLSKTKNDLT